MLRGECIISKVYASSLQVLRKLFRGFKREKHAVQMYSRLKKQEKSYRQGI